MNNSVLKLSDSSIDISSSVVFSSIVFSVFNVSDCSFFDFFATSIKNSDDIPYINFVKFWTENTRLKIFEETGHYITIEEPEIVNKQITEWLENLKIHLR